MRRPQAALAASSATVATAAGQVPVVRVVPATVVVLAPMDAATVVAIAAHRPVVSATVLRASKTAARVWAMPLSAPSAKRSNARTWRCASSRRKPTAKR